MSPVSTRINGIFLLFCLLFSVSRTEAAGIAIRQPHEEVGKKHFLLEVILLDRKQRPVPAAAVQVEPCGLWGISDGKGKASIGNIPFNPRTVYQVSVSVLGFRNIVREMKPEAGKNTLTFILEEENFALKEVVVVAENRKSGESTASRIGRQAIDHLQATSLKDLLQLIPGQVNMKNPSLTGEQYFGLRTLNSGKSFGSSILVDGIPLSTNADMGAGFSSIDKGDKGVDLRSLGTDNIQSVEIIRGIASAEYGDASGGTMLVNSRAGISGLNVRAKIMPGIKQFYAGKGFKAGKAGNFNLSADYATGKSDPRYTTDTYDRILGSLTHTKSLKDGKWFITTRLNFTSVKDWSGADPDEPEALQKYYRERRDRNILLSHSGRFNHNGRLTGTLKYDLAYTNNSIRSRKEELISAGAGAIFDATEEGMYTGSPLPFSYGTVSGVRSNPVSYYAKITDIFHLDAGSFLNRFNVGAEIRSEGNEGSGRYDAGHFPAFAEDRVRSYKDIPYLTQISAYAEDRFSLPLGKEAYPNIKGQVGIRWTMAQPGKKEEMQVFSPRVNLSFNPVEWLSLRGGFGQSEKIPSLYYLYPDKEYYDFYNMSVNNGTDRFYLYSTRIFDLENPDLAPMRNTKWETGIDMKFRNGMKFSITGYRESVRNGFGNDNSAWTALQFDRWKAEDVRFEGSEPIYDITRPSFQEKVLHNISRPGNISWERNSGIEFDFDLGRIRQTNTAFYLNGAYAVTEYHSKNLTYRLPTGETRTYGNVWLVYPEGTGSTQERRRFSAALRAVQHIPAINFIVTATAQFIFHEYEHSIDIAERPMGYITDDGGPDKWKNGRGNVRYVPFHEADFNNPGYSFEGFMLKDQTFGGLASNIPTKWPSVWVLNLRVTKEIDRYLGFSFYANNFLFHQPWQTTNTSSNPIERNSNLFSYGLEMFLHF